MPQRTHITWYVAKVINNLVQPVILYSADSEKEANDLADVLIRTQHEKWIVLKSEFTYDDTP